METKGNLLLKFAPRVDTKFCTSSGSLQYLALLEPRKITVLSLMCYLMPLSNLLLNEILICKQKTILRFPKRTKKNSIDH